MWKEGFVVYFEVLTQQVFRLRIAPETAQIKRRRGTTSFRSSIWLRTVYKSVTIHRPKYISFLPRYVAFSIKMSI